jgi:hypothetical protein
MGVVRVIALVAVGVVSAACFGKLAVSVSNDVQPAVILPGGVVAQEIRIEADGAFGGLIRQSLAQASASPSSPGWDVRDNSDGSTLRLRMSRTVAIGSSELATGASSGGMQGGSVDVHVDDYVIARHFVAIVTVPPLSLGSSTSANSSSGAALGQQITQLALSGVSFDESLTMPGSVTTTNGIAGDGSRIVWHLKLDSTASQTLRAESIYPDWPRISAVGALVVLLMLAAVFRRRTLASR